MIVNDIPLTIPFRIKDIDTGHYIYSITDKSAPGDLPPDIALLKVVGVMIDQRSQYMEIETEMKGDF